MELDLYLSFVSGCCLVKHLLSYSLPTTSVTALVNMAMCWLPYPLLVEVGVLCATMPWILLLAVFVYLRFAKPKMVRPFKVRSVIKLCELRLLIPKHTPN